MKTPKYIYAALSALLLLCGCQKEEVKLHHIYLSSTTDKAAPGDTVHFRVLPYPAESTTGFPNESVRWSSSDTTVASTDSNGLVRAHKYGITAIRADYGPFYAEKTITVSEVVHIGDVNLRRFIMERYDTNADGILEGYETATMTGLDLTNLNKLTLSDVDLTGIEFFVNLQTLRIEYLKIGKMDLSSFSDLRELHIEGCEICAIDLSMNNKIEDVRITACPMLTVLNLGNYNEHGENRLRTLQCSRCDISTIDLTRCSKTLWDLDCSQNPRLATIDLRTDTMLHSIVYSCDVTDVVWPEKNDLDEVIRPRCE